MNQYEVVDGSVRHIKPLSEILRPASCAAIRGYGINPRRALLSAFQASSYVRTALMGEKPVAMWGAQGVMLSDQRTVWLAISKEAANLPLAVVRLARSELAVMAGNGSRLYAGVIEQDERAMVFAETIGFRRTDEVSAAPGMQAMVYRRPQNAIADGDRPPFIVHGLGRSRTAWLAAFLSYGKWTCLHEQAVNLRSASDVREFLSKPRTGYAETAAHFGWPLIVRARPDVRQVVIARSARDAMAAMAERYEQDAIPFDRDKMERIFLRANKTLGKISGLPNTLTVAYDDLETEAGCKAVFEFCLPYKWDHAWWLNMRDQYVDSDLVGFVERFNTERSRVDEVKRDLKIELFKTVRADAVR